MVVGRTNVVQEGGPFPFSVTTMMQHSYSVLLPLSRSKRSKVSWKVPCARPLLVEFSITVAFVESVPLEQEMA